MRMLCGRPQRRCFSDRFHRKGKSQGRLRCESSLLRRQWVPPGGQIPILARIVECLSSIDDHPEPPRYGRWPKPLSGRCHGGAHLPLLRRPGNLVHSAPDSTGCTEAPETSSRRPCQVNSRRDGAGICGEGQTAGSGGDWTHVGHLAPALISRLQRGAVLGGGQEMAPDPEAVAEAAIGREETLSAGHGFEPLHSPLA